MSIRDARGSGEILKVAIVGPECTGKSTLAEALANHYQTVWVPEYARGYLDNLVRPYNEDDLLSIGRGQLRLENSWLRTANRVLVCDTDLLVLKVWSDFKYGHTSREILDEMNLSSYDLHLLTYIDVPWVEDPLREHPHQRDVLFDIYHKELKKAGVPFVEIRGSAKERLEAAVTAINKLFG